MGGSEMCFKYFSSADGSPRNAIIDKELIVSSF